MSNKDSAVEPSKKGRAASIGLTKERVVSAALKQIDEEGLAKFSIRKLASQLGVSTAVIYWHVGGKQEDLFSEISAAITTALTDGIDENSDWQTRLRSIFRRYRKLVHQHPNVSPLLGAQMKSNGVANLVWVEAVLSSLHQAGFSGETLKSAFNSLIGGLSGFVTMELAPAPAEKNDAWHKTFAQRLNEIDPTEYPLTHAALPLISNQVFVLRWQNGVDVSYDSSFELLLDLLIDGLAYRAQQLKK